MSNIADLKLSNLADLGYTGTINDAEFEYLGSLGLSGTLDDRIKGWLLSLGYDNIKEYLLGLGYSGTIQDMLLASLTDSAFYGAIFQALVSDSSKIMQGVLRGTGDLTTTHASTIYQLDHEDVWRAFTTDVDVIRGGRVVQQLLYHSEDLTAAADWSLNGTAAITAGITDPLGGTSAFQLDIPVENTDSIVQDLRNSPYISGINLIYSVWLKADSPGTVRLVDGSCGGGGGLDLYANVTTSWQRFVVSGTTACTTPQFFLGHNSGSTLTKVYVWRPMAENASGRADTSIPSEYVPSTGSARAQKVYCNINGNSVTDNVVTEATGVDITPTPWLWNQPAVTNFTQYSHDLTNAYWASSCVRAYNQVGLTGEPNTASLITDNNAGGGASVSKVYTVPNDSNVNVAKIYIHKISSPTYYPGLALSYSGGSATNVFLMINPETGAYVVTTSGGGAVYTIESEDLGDWYCFYLSLQNNGTGNTSLTLYMYPAYGLIWGTPDGAATGGITIGNVELHLGKTTANVRGAGVIFTTSAAAGTDTTVYTFDLANHADSNSAYYLEWMPYYADTELASINGILSSSNASATDLLYDLGATSHINSYDGTNSVAKAATWAVGDTLKLGLVYDTTQAAVVVDGSSTEGDYDGDHATTGALTIGYDPVACSGFRDLRRYVSTYDTGLVLLEDLTA